MAVVVSVPDEVIQEVGIVFVTTRGRAEITEERLRGFAKERLANDKVPKRIHVCDALPSTIVGKIDKPLLQRLAAGEQEGLDELLGGES